MILFLSSFFIVYGLMHALFFFRVKKALGIKRIFLFPLVIFMLLMVVCPIIARVSENAGYEEAATFALYTGYTWMGFLLLFTFFSLVFSMYPAMVRILGKVTKRNVSSYLPSPLAALLLPAILSVALNVYGFFEAHDIRTERIIIHTPKLGGGEKRIVIAQISDVHLGLMIGEKRLSKIAGILMKVNPDILVATGDLVDGQMDNLNGVADILAAIRPRLGKYAVMGNHEFIAGIEQASAFIQKTGFVPLRGEAVIVGNALNIVGVDDFAGKRYGGYRDISEPSLLRSVRNGLYTVLLKHRPFADPDSAGLFDLQLSGHTHRGQLFPFSLFTALYYPRHAGILEAGQDSMVYISRGTGTWGPLVRIGAPPEITIIEIVSMKNN